MSPSKTSPRVALYARFSTDLQRQTSIADQLLAARARAAAEGWPITTEHADEAVSGSVPLMLRAGGKALLADALAARFEILIVEGLDRLSRDVGEQDQVVKRLEYRGIRLIGTSDGYDTNAKGRKVMRVARGLVNELYLDDLRDKTHRGLAGQFGRGFSAGGRSFGYRTVEAAGGRRIVIEEAEAALVRQIFQQAAEGRSPRQIVYDLNARGVRSARGGTWALSALAGSTARGLGLLQNELYRGHVIWNRRQWLKDPETGSRRYIERPRAEWQERDAPELRIVSEELWLASRSTRRPDYNAKGGARPSTLFGGLLRCGACAGPIVAINALHYGCSVHKDRGPTVCACADTWRRKHVDRRLVAELRGELLGADAMRDLQGEIRASVAQLLRDVDRPEQRRRRTELQGQVGRLVDAIAQVGISASLATRLASAEAELEQLEAQQRRGRATASDASGVADKVLREYRERLMQLESALGHLADRAQTRQILGTLLGRVTLLKDESGESYAEIEEPAERLLIAAAGGVDMSGCEGPQRRSSTRRRLRL